MLISFLNKKWKKKVGNNSAATLITISTIILIIIAIPHFTNYYRCPHYYYNCYY